MLLGTWYINNGLYYSLFVFSGDYTIFWIFPQIECPFDQEAYENQKFCCLKTECFSFLCDSTKAGRTGGVWRLVGFAFE